MLGTFNVVWFVSDLWTLLCSKSCHLGDFLTCRYYPYHYAPYLSDIHNISELKIKFELGKPFMPFEQLLAVLPAASKDLLPKCYQVRSRIKLHYLSTAYSLSALFYFTLFLVVLHVLLIKFYLCILDVWLNILLVTICSAL